MLEDMIGARLGNWVIDRELGYGGMGRVYLAHDESRQAAVKVLAAELALDAGFQQRFQREIEAARRLEHPHIVRFFESGQQDGRYYYVMEYVEGQSFEELLLENGRLPWAEVMDLALQVAPALKHAHDRGVIHRDIKPSNLLRTPAGVVKLTDFGIAHVFASTPLTLSGVVVGTGEYLSPEQAAGKPVTRRSDLYSLGVVLYTLLTGRTPFTGNNLPDLLHKHLYARFDPPEKLVPEVPSEFAAVVCQLLEKDPSKRPADGQVLFKRLDSIRRRLEFQNARTKVITTDEPAAEGEDLLLTRERRLRKPGPATIMGRLMRDELAAQQERGPIARLFQRPGVLAVLLLLTLAALVWAFWPPSAESLFRRGAALMQSEDPDDWEAAWSRYLSKLQSRYPDHPHQEEVEEFRRRLEEHRARQAERGVGRNRIPGEAQWFYQLGQRLRQQGDEAAARRVWENLVRSFDGVEAEQLWVRRAQEQLQKSPAPPGKGRWAPVLAALDRARQLRDQGKQAEAEAIWQGLEELYRDDSSAADILTRIKTDRGK
jgi:serine/threonine-protein kinase